MYQSYSLDLLKAYGDDSSDDDVPNGRVSTKRTFKEDANITSRKLLKKLPLPEIILPNVISPESLTDDPSTHDGRIRAFPHERGNWVSYVYIPYEINASMETLVNFTINSLSKFELKIVDHFHISLTKTVVLRHHWIDLFVETVKNATICIPRFMIVFHSLEVYCNEERSRTFLGLQIRSGYDTLVNIVQCLDNCLSEFQLPSFYKDPSFHMSIAWCLGDREEEIKLALPSLNNYLEELVNNSPQSDWYIIVSFLQCKIGNKFFNFSLS